jgi:hypothetical protein
VVGQRVHNLLQPAHRGGAAAPQRGAARSETGRASRPGSSRRAARGAQLSRSTHRTGVRPILGDRANGARRRVDCGQIAGTTFVSTAV